MVGSTAGGARGGAAVEFTMVWYSGEDGAGAGRTHVLGWLAVPGRPGRMPGWLLCGHAVDDRYWGALRCARVRSAARASCSGGRGDTDGLRVPWLADVPALTLASWPANGTDQPSCGRCFGQWQQLVEEWDGAPPPRRRDPEDAAVLDELIAEGRWH